MLHKFTRFAVLPLFVIPLLQCKAREPRPEVSEQYAAAAAGNGGIPNLGRTPHIQLSSYTGQTFLSAMGKNYKKLTNGEIKKLMNDDFDGTFMFPDSKTARARLAGVDRAVYGKSTKQMGDTGFDNLMTTMASNKANLAPRTLIDAVDKGLKQSGEKGSMFSLAALIGIAGQTGTMVVLDSKNYYLNVGYAKGLWGEPSPTPAQVSAVQTDVMSGRSFGGTPKHKLLDASDIFYLNSLEDYLTGSASAKGQSDLYKAVLMMVLQSDPSMVKSLTVDGQAVATDFMAVYNAELARHMMGNLKGHSWEWDLLEATLMAGFVTETGENFIHENGGKYGAGHVRNFWAKGPSGRSGIGVAKRERHRLQMIITKYERQNNQKLVDNLEAALGVSAVKDVFATMSEQITFSKEMPNASRVTPTFKSQADVYKASDSIIKATVALLAQVRTDAKAIAKVIKTSPGGGVSASEVATNETEEELGHYAGYEEELFNGVPEPNEI